MPPVITHDAAPPPFPAHARAVVRSVRGSFADLLTAVGADPHDPASISERTGLTKTLAWKISKIVQADDPGVALLHMPGSSGVKLLLRGAERAGVARERLDSARDALTDFERLIDVHCGDRATLEMMGGQLSPSGRQQRDEQHRRSLFQGGSYVWGVQARVILKVGIVAPGEENGLLDFASINAMIDFRRLRPDVSWVISSRHSQYDDGSAMSTMPTEPIDPRYAAPDQAPLMAEFCTESVLNLRRTVDANSISFELVEGPVGATGALTCVFGAIQRRIPYYATKQDDWGEHRARCDVPAELMILDLFVHESLAFAIPPEVFHQSDLGGPGAPAAGRQRLPMAESIQDLGVGALAPATPEAPDYRRMVQAAYDRLGRRADEFHGFRLRVAFPAFPTAYILRYRLPDAPRA